MKIKGLRASRVGAFFLAVLVLETGLGIVSGGGSVVLARKADDRPYSDQRPDPATPIEQSHSRAALSHLDTAIKALQSDDFNTALASYDQILADQEAFNPFDVAIAYKMRGMANVAAQEYEAALADLKLAIAHPALAPKDASDLQLVAARLTFRQGRVEEAVGLIDAWFDEAETPTAEALFFAAQAHLDAGLLSKAERFVEQGLAKMESGAAQESFYAIAVAVYIQQKKFDDALPLLRTMESLWPQS